MKQLRAFVDTSLGVEAVTLNYAGRGVLVVERIIEKCAEALRLPVDEVYELIRVDRLDGPEA